MVIENLKSPKIIVVERISHNVGEQIMNQRNIVIFGAGSLGKQALSMYKDRVRYFVDNNPKIQNTLVEGIPVKRVEALKKDENIAQIVIAGKFSKSMEQQLQKMGVTNYITFLQDPYAYYVSEDIIFNPYTNSADRDRSEKEWNELTQNSYKVDEINKEVDQLYLQKKLFNHVEIETVNRCNGYCDFCPVSKNRDTREYMEMSDDLFKSIIDQLAEINYNGKLALFSNNEPFLDQKIISRHQYAREKLPYARMHLFTNGTLLTVEMFVEIMKYLDELIIDNYQQELKLIKPCKEISEYCAKHPEYRKKVTIVLRKPKEILTTRGGDAPNRKEKISYAKAKCVLPFKQLIIRPDGKVSLCCNDPLGKVTLGDLRKEKILDVWNNEHFACIRENLQRGRENLQHCKYCDFFSGG